MSREVRRVPLDFDCPIGDTWAPLFMPKSLHEDPCPDCEGGYSPQAQRMRRQWYGNAFFGPWMTGSIPFTVETPAVREFAERNTEHSPWYYGTGEAAIIREAQRLLGHWNASWGHHLAQADVDALVASGRLVDFTHTFTPTDGWKAKDPVPNITAADVNEWSLRGFGHDSINMLIAIQARCERENVDINCHTCDGQGSLEAYPGQRAEAEAWEPPDIPTGPGWQLWQTVSEGGPVSPVYDTPEALAEWMRGQDRWSTMSPSEALHFVTEAGSSFGSFIFTPSAGVIDGVTAAATTPETR